jgi:hypothetical protein
VDVLQVPDNPNDTARARDNWDLVSLTSEHLCVDENILNLSPSVQSRRFDAVAGLARANVQRASHFGATNQYGQSAMRRLSI